VELDRPVCVPRPFSWLLSFPPLSAASNSIRPVRLYFADPVRGGPGALSIERACVMKSFTQTYHTTVLTHTPHPLGQARVVKVCSYVRRVASDDDGGLRLGECGWVDDGNDGLLKVRPTATL
jgi:hypothetical protein